MYCLKVSFEHLSKNIKIENIFAFEGKKINNLPYRRNRFDDILTLIKRLIDEDGNIFRRLRSILSIFKILDETVDDSKTFISIAESERLKNLIKWTNENFNKRILIDDAANQMNFSKYYFCKYFKLISTGFISHLSESSQNLTRNEVSEAG